MASKLTVFAALFVCFVVLADATFRVTTTVVEDENPQQFDQCRQQLQRQKLQSCRSYVSRQQQQQGGGWDLIEMNPQQSVEQCCQELRQVETECRCEALEQIQEKVQQEQQEQQQQGGRFGGSSGSRSQKQKIQQQVRRIPQMCSIQVPQQCQQTY